MMYLGKVRTAVNTHYVLDKNMLISPPPHQLPVLISDCRVLQQDTTLRQVSESINAARAVNKRHDMV